MEGWRAGPASPGSAANSEHGRRADLNVGIKLGAHRVILGPPRHVPEVDTDLPAACDRHRLDAEVDAYGGHVLVDKLLLAEALDQARFAHALVAHRDDLDPAGLEQRLAGRECRHSG
eukprot:scaffold9177_cov101-Isochrysis_galbana.AAC.1